MCRQSPIEEQGWKQEDTEESYDNSSKTYQQFDIGSGKKSLDSGICGLMDVGSDTARRIRDNSKTFGLSHCKNGEKVTEDWLEHRE